MNRNEERELSKLIRGHLLANPKLKGILLSDVTDRMTADLAPLVVTGQGEYRREYRLRIDKRRSWFQRVKAFFFGEATPGSW